LHRVKSWLVVARAPKGGSIAAYTRDQSDGLGKIVDAGATLHRIAEDGTVTPLPLHDAKGQPVRLGLVDALAVAPAGTIYVADRDRRQLLAITPAGETRVLAGKVLTDADHDRRARDGDATSAVFTYVHSLAVDKRGNVWVADNKWVRVVTPQGEVRTFRNYPEAAGKPSWLDERNPPDSKLLWFDGLGESVLIAADNKNEIWLWVHSRDGRSRSGSHLYRVDEQGRLQPATLPAFPPSTLDPGKGWYPRSMAFGPDGSLYLHNVAVWAIKPDGRGNISADSRVDWIAGVVGIDSTAVRSSTPWRSPDGQRDGDLPSWPPNEDIARSYEPADGDMRSWSERDKRTRIYLTSLRTLSMHGRDTLLAGVDSGDILRIARDNHVSFVANLAPGRLTAESPLAVGIKRAVMAPDGSVYYIDSFSLRRVTPDGRDIRVARLAIGMDEFDSPGDLYVDLSPYQSHLSTFHSPSDLLLDGQGNVLIAEPYTALIRKVTPNGEVSTVAGLGKDGKRPRDDDEKTPRDGNLRAASFGMPQRLAIDRAGNVYVLDRTVRRSSGRGWGGSIRKIDLAAGNVTTVARAGDEPAIEISGGYADIAIGKDDQLLVLDEDGTVWVIDDSGRHKAIATSPAFLKHPKELVADRLGNLYIGSIFKVGKSDVSRVARIDARGNAAVVMGPSQGDSNVGGSTSAKFNGLGGMRLTPRGDLLVVMGSAGGFVPGYWDSPSIRNQVLPMQRNDMASGLAVIEGIADIP